MSVAWLLMDEISAWSDNFVCRTRSREEPAWTGPPHSSSSQVRAWMQLIHSEETVKDETRDCVYMPLLSRMHSPKGQYLVCVTTKNESFFLRAICAEQSLRNAIRQTQMPLVSSFQWDVTGSQLQQCHNASPSRLSRGSAK